MTNFKFSILDDEPFTGTITLDKCEEDEEVIPRELGETLCLNEFIAQNTQGKLSLGNFKISLDFDSNGELMSIKMQSREYR